LFARGVGQETDIVGKEMYTFDDRDGNSLTLRPEATASVIRAYIEHRLDQVPGIKKLYYLGPMFRRERPQKGRYRQFFQIGAEAIGSESPAVDAEVIEMVVELLRRCGLEGFQLLINSVGCANCRPEYIEVLRERLKEVAPRMCGDCQRRAMTNALRVLDCKVPQDQPIIDSLPHADDYLCEECRAHFDAVKRHLSAAGIPFRVSHRLVRGLDYYTRTTFEILGASLGAQNALLGGGRYDGLVKRLGGPERPGIGFAAGLERMVLAMPDPAGARDGGLFVAAIGDEARDASIALLAELRRAGLVAQMEYDARGVKAQLKRADRLGASRTVIVGGDELARGEVTVRDMKTGEQIAVKRSDIAQWLKR
jgi:histidyl-tRNA synthetase